MNRKVRTDIARDSALDAARVDRGWASQIQMSAGRRDVLAEIMGELWIILLVTVLVVGIVAGQPWIIAVTVMTGVIAIGARVWARLALEELYFTRTVERRYLFPGEITELTLTLENKKPLPIPWLKIRDEIPIELEALNAKTTRTERSDSMRLEDSLSVGWYERVRHRFKVRAVKRGYVQLGPGQMEAGDLFGLFRSRLSLRTSEAIVIYPNVVPLDDFNFPSGRPMGDAPSRRRMYEDTNRPSGVREYIAGDPIRRIDWKITARLRTPHVRTYDHTVDQYMIVLLDATTSSKPWEGFNSVKLERAITAAASIVTKGDEFGFRIGLVSNGVPLAGSGQMVIKPGADPRQLPILLEALAMVRPVVVKSLTDVIARSPEAIPFGSTVVAISAVMSEPLVLELERLKRDGHPTVGIYVGDGDPDVWAATVDIRSEGARFEVAELARTGDDYDV
ncbi:MAG: DUF58 domain-containing protein [Chloroflexi bacterium]|nr:DUF58 domain-containing protein [Chloroflexota bacterium]